MKVKCYSVRLKSLTKISDKCYKAQSFDGKEDLIPASQIFGADIEINKSDAYWISEWILSKKNLQYSTKKACIFDQETGAMLDRLIKIEQHIPPQLQPLEAGPDESLIR